MNARIRARLRRLTRGASPWSVGLALSALALLPAAPVVADLVSPPLPVETPLVPLTLVGLFDLAIRTMLERGVAYLLLGSLAVVGIPWAMAGLAVAAFDLPGRWRRRR